MAWRLIKKLYLALALFAACSAQAQTATDEYKFFDRALDVTFGRMLPYNIYGVRDIYPYTGVRLTHKIWGIYPEYSATFINGGNVNFYSGSLSVMFPDQFAGFTLLSFVGVDAHYFSGHTTTRKLPFVNSGGFHMGASPVIELSEHFGLRADFKLNFGPGMSLLVGGGIIGSF